MRAQSWCHAGLCLYHCKFVAHFSFLLSAVGEYNEHCAFENFKAECGADEVVVMQTANYGRMKLGRCVRKDLGYVGCSADVLYETDRFCSGRRKCDVQVGAIGALLEGRLPCLEELKSYLEASYKCIRGNN